MLAVVFTASKNPSRACKYSRFVNFAEFIFYDEANFVLESHESFPNFDFYACLHFWEQVQLALNAFKGIARLRECLNKISNKFIFSCNFPTLHEDGEQKRRHNAKQEKFQGKVVLVYHETAFVVGKGPRIIC